MPQPPTHETLVALHVTDDAGYARYRAAMTPILQRFGGSFRYDFEVARVLQPADGPPLNRVFILSFPDAVAKQAFFTDSAYRQVREEHFTASVGATAILAEYTRADSG